METNKPEWSKPKMRGCKLAMGIKAKRHTTNGLEEGLGVLI